MLPEKCSMNRADQLVHEIRAYCAANANPALAAKYARYFKEGYDSWGLMDAKHPMWNAQKEDWAQRYHSLGLNGFLQLGEILFATGKYEEGAIAIHFLKPFAATAGPAILPGIEKWFRAGINNWAHTDVLCGELLSPALAEGRIPYDAFAPWRQSPCKYQRRAVPVALLGLLKTAAPPQPLLDFIEPLMHDPERVVHQGLGWFLREQWKLHPAPVEQFLLRFKDTAPRLIFQYATEKMTPPEKARFRAQKPPKAK
jgi:3-methyladenine DNA glycosylase AlkD